MRFSTKIFYSIFSTSIITCLFGGFIVFSIVKKNIEEEYFYKYQYLMEVLSNTFGQLELSADLINENAVKFLYEIDKKQKIPKDSELEKLAKQLKIKSFYVINKNGKFIRSSDLPIKFQVNSLFDYCKDYKKLIKGSKKIFITPIITGFPNNIPMKLTMIPNHNRTLILESGIELEYIGKILHQAVKSDKNIKSIGFYTPTGLELGFISESGDYKRGRGNSSKEILPGPFFQKNSSTSIYTKKIPLVDSYCCECVNKKISDPAGQYYYILKMEVSNNPLFKKISFLNSTTILILIFSIFLSVFISKILAKKLVSRLRKINRTASKIIKSGNLNLQVITKGNDEISHLAETFNKMIQALKTTQETLVESEKMRAIAKMAAQLAHDIRSPLAVMEITLITLSKNTSDAQRLMLSEAIQNIRDIANNLLERYRNDERNISDYPIVSSEVLLDDGNVPRPLLLSSLIESAISQKRQEWHDKPCFFKIIISPYSMGQWIIAAPNQIKRILSNLLNNAYEALELRRDIQIELTKIENKLQLKISDSGQGIPSDKIDAVLSGVSLKHKGEGLGLVSAKRYLSSLEGELILSSIEFEGTDVLLRFPIAPQPIWFPSSIVIFKNTIIVILDDDPSIHNLWRHRLESYGIKGYHFLAADEMIRWCKNNTDLFNRIIFLMDYELKDNTKSGLDLLEMFNPGSRGYLITSHGEEVIIQQRCEKLGLNLIPKCLLGIMPIEMSET